MKSTSHSMWLAVLALLLGVNLLVGFQVFSKEADASGEKEAFEKVGIMMQVLHLIRQDYVHADKIDYTDLLYSATRGMVSSLDPFSDFLNPEEYRDMIDITEGKFGGLGITITVKNGVLTVVSPMESSPASKAGILPGDQIVKIADESTKDLAMDDAVNRLKGDPGTTITLTVFRPSTQQTLPFTLARAVIDLPTITDAQVLDDGIGYVRITEFADPTARKLQEALEALQKEKIKALIVDVRNNPGGLLDSAVDVCSYFLPSKRLVVSTEGRRPSQKQEFFTDSRRKIPAGITMAILINQGSASAAEILAGCLQDYNRAILIGEKSFGKGSVQNLIPLADGSALRLTTAMYYTPSRRVIHEHGIEPNISVSLNEAELRRLWETNGASLLATRKLNPANDRQLQRAMEVLKSYEAFQQAQKGRFAKLPVPAPVPAAAAAAAVAVAVAATPDSGVAKPAPAPAPVATPVAP